MKKFTLFIISLFLTIGTLSAQNVLYTTTVFDFTNNAWEIPGYDLIKYQGVRDALKFEHNGLVIELVPNGKNKGEYYYDDGFLRLAKTGSKIVLPTFDFPVEKIVLVGHPSATGFSKVDMNVYVGGVAVSTPSVGSTDTYTYEIDAEYQAAGKVYELIIGSGGGEYSSVMYITAIKVYPAVNRLEAPVFDMPSGVYTEPITVTVSSPTANLDGVSDVIYYYTTDGNEPDEECDETEDEIVITESCTLKAAVELVYKEKTYTSESTSVEYVISEKVEGVKAADVAAGTYFIAAGNKLATLYGDKCLAVKDIESEQDGTIVDALYYTFAFEGAAGNFYIKDFSGNYISLDLSGKIVSDKYENSATKWNVIVENGFAKISAAIIINDKEVDYFLVYDAVAECFKAEEINDQTVFPELYKVTLPSTAIEEVKTESAEPAIYDLSGRRVKEITVKGIYIVNGKKVVK